MSIFFVIKIAIILRKIIYNDMLMNLNIKIVLAF